MNVLGGLLGLFLLITVIVDAFEAMLLPKRIRRPIRFVRLFFRSTWSAWGFFGKKLTGQSRDSFLSVYGPLSMVGLLVCWAAGLIFGFGLLRWAFAYGSPDAATLATSVYFSGASFFTVGNALAPGKSAKILTVLEAGTGLAFIAVTIAYLPVLYQLFSRRETYVIQLDARAGSPPSALALLCRHGENDALDELACLFREWERWCAELVESHLAYPMLSYYRSQHDNQSWLAAIATIMDACVVLLTGLRGVRTFAARMTFPIARLAIVELCRVFQVKLLTSEPDRLPPEVFAAFRDELAEAGLFFSEEETAEKRLAALRATYEPFLFALSYYLLVSLPDWVPEDTPDNWNRSSRGKSAKQLVESAPVEPQ